MYNAFFIFVLISIDYFNKSLWFTSETQIEIIENYLNCKN